MKLKTLLFYMSGAMPAYAGTPGNSDISIIYGIAMAFLVGMFGVDYLIKYIKKRKELSKTDHEEKTVDEISDETSADHPIK